MSSGCILSIVLPTAKPVSGMMLPYMLVTHLFLRSVFSTLIFIISRAFFIMLLFSMVDCIPFRILRVTYLLTSKMIITIVSTPNTTIRMYGAVYFSLLWILIAFWYVFCSCPLCSISASLSSSKLMSNLSRLQNLTAPSGMSISASSTLVMSYFFITIFSVASQPTIYW